MSINRYSARKDENHSEIVSGLRAVGAAVYVLNGAGLPDLMVLYRGKITLLEVKGSKGKLRQRQKDFLENAQIQGVEVKVVRTVNGALDAIGVELWRQDLYSEIGALRPKAMREQGGEE